MLTGVMHTLLWPGVTFVFQAGTHSGLSHRRHHSLWCNLRLLCRCYKLPLANNAAVPPTLRKEMSGVCKACFAGDSRGRAGHMQVRHKFRHRAAAMQALLCNRCECAKLSSGLWVLSVSVTHLHSALGTQSRQMAAPLATLADAPSLQGLSACLCVYTSCCVFAEGCCVGPSIACCAGAALRCPACRPS
jgi:hypothetical protein